MTITVENFCKKFSGVSELELKRLVGKNNFEKTDVIPLINLATSSNQAYKNYGYAQGGESFINLMGKEEQVRFSRTVDHKPSRNLMTRNSLFTDKNNKPKPQNYQLPLGSNFLAVG